MSEQPDPPATCRTALDPGAAAALRAHAAAERARADKFAAALEDIADNGLPPLEQCRPWADIREEALAQLRAQREAGHAA